MNIVTGGIVLRPWSVLDASALAAIANNRTIADNLRDEFPYPYSEKDAVKWLNMIIPENNPVRFFAIVFGEEIAGSIGIVPKMDIYRKNAEIGYFVGEKFRRKGIATTAIREVTSYAFQTFDILRVYAEPFADNILSRKALEKAGFSLDATLRRNVIKNKIVKDSCIYSILREEWINI